MTTKKTKKTRQPRWTPVERIALRATRPEPKVFELPAETRKLWDTISGL
jgi:hypothetical protein